ncbi:MAG: acyl-CoA thioesterase [Myxococcales bacterium]|nr:acyl-CoA thioesterase [Myxococcales bacterium]
MGVVYYANYFRYFEAGRNELLRSGGFAYRRFEDAGYKLPVTAASAKYGAPAQYDDELLLITRVVHIRLGSVRITYELKRVADGMILTTGETTHACVGKNGRVCRIPPAMREALGEGLLGSEGTGKGEAGS